MKRVALSNSNSKNEWSCWGFSPLSKEFNFVVQVNTLVDSLDVRQLNSVNLRSAVSAALLLLPPEFTEVVSFFILHLCNC